MSKRIILSLMAALMLALLLAGVCYSEQSTGVYRTGPEDVINVTVVRHPEFSGEFFIPADGTINLPGVGQMNARGKTLGEISDYIVSRLKDRLRDPEVTVSLKTPRMQRIYVLGAVEKPGLYDMKEGWRVTEAVAAAGGLSGGVESNDCCATILSASSGKRQTVKLADALRGAQGMNITVASGDVVTIDAPETLPVYVNGKVKNPGFYRLRKDGASVMEALTLAGGTLEEAALNRVTITHSDGKSLTVDLAQAMVHGKQSQNVPVQAGDLIVVPEETSRIAVLGFVNEPGFYPLKNGTKLTLSDALGMAKGVDNKRGSLNSVVVVRSEEGKQQRLSFDYRKFLKSGDLSQNPEIRPGDVVFVPETNKPDLGILFNALTSIGLLL